jgi:chitin disaccharide deacetylase
MRYLIVNADDFGQTAGINRGIVEAHERGVVTSASLLVLHPAAAEAAELARRHPALSVGLHLDYGEWGRVRDTWYPIYEVDARSPRAALRAARRQLERFRELMGRDPTHLDSHQHAHRIEPVQAVALTLAAELGVPLRHFTDAVRYQGSFYGHVNGEPRLEAITPEALAALIAELQPGVTEIGCHPGYPEGLYSSYCDERRTELATLCSPVVRSSLATYAIELVSFETAPLGGQTGSTRHGG